VAYAVQTVEGSVVRHAAHTLVKRHKQGEVLPLRPASFRAGRIYVEIHYHGLGLSAGIAGWVEVSIRVVRELIFAAFFNWR
jgi:hypothetical protein